MYLRTDYNSWGFPGEAMELEESFEDVGFKVVDKDSSIRFNNIIEMVVVKKNYN